MNNIRIVEESNDPLFFWQNVKELQLKNLIFNSAYTISAMKFYRQRFLDEGKNPRSVSFLLMRDENPVICFFGYIYNNEAKY